MNITKGEWKLRGSNKIFVGDTCNSICTVHVQRSGISIIGDIDSEMTANANAIVTAVNETYGKGINPSAAEEMLNTLIYIQKIIEKSDCWWIDCQDKVGFDTSIIDAAIEKAKLAKSTNRHLFDVNEKKFYLHDAPELKERTKKRLTEIADLGMELVGVAQFGYKRVMSGLYIEKVWSYSDEEFKDYMDWAKGLIKEKLNRQ